MRNEWDDAEHDAESARFAVSHGNGNSTSLVVGNALFPLELQMCWLSCTIFLFNPCVDWENNPFNPSKGKSFNSSKMIGYIYTYYTLYIHPIDGLKHLYNHGFFIDGIIYIIYGYIYIMYIHVYPIYYGYMMYIPYIMDCILLYFGYILWYILWHILPYIEILWIYEWCICPKPSGYLT